ncbi:EbsA family protein [Periweissella fabalis]|uniref:EbsA family protein n=1 Tax=Periweissella fabalis TaxID=1070421 RepID=A0A7X6N1B2_9LACO|nr:EbsA family protein [Periweissella fabalis]MCM0598970.1 hypothetical protein [Periweissella fabalis]NKZ23250.1 EbsA family protein [Periweissella fabalis]
MKPVKSFYQPSGLMWIISWSWVAAIGLLSLIIQLEITHFNFWTGVTLIIFIVALVLSILRRRVYLIDERMYIGRIFYHYDSIDLRNLEAYSFGKQHRFTFTKNGHEHSYLLQNKFLEQVKTTIDGFDLERN